MKKIAFLTLFISLPVFSDVPPPNFILRLDWNSEDSGFFTTGGVSAHYYNGSEKPDLEGLACVIHKNEGENSCSRGFGYVALCPQFISYRKFALTIKNSNQSPAGFSFDEDLAHNETVITYTTAQRQLTGAVSIKFLEAPFPTSSGAIKSYDNDVATRISRRSANIIVNDDLYLTVQTISPDLVSGLPDYSCPGYVVIDEGGGVLNVWDGFGFVVPPEFITNESLVAVANVSDLPPITLTDAQTGESFFYSAISIDSNSRVTYGNPCTVGVDANCGEEDPEEDPEKNEGKDPCGQGNPINIGVGNKYQTVSDYSAANIFPLTVARTYNSISGGWQFLAEIRPSADLTSARVVRPDGKKLPFTSSTPGVWVTDEDVTGVLLSLDDGIGNITGWRYTTLDQTVEDYDAAGRLLKVTDRTGLSHNYQHSSSSIVVTHTNGDTLTYQLDGVGRINGFTTPDNETYSYNYDGAGNLTGIAYPNNGGVRIYHYEDSNFPNALTGITDANGDRFATWSYDPDGRAVSSEHFNGAERVTMDYSNLDDIYDRRTTTTNALGKETTFHFKTIQGVRKVVQVEGHASTHCAAANQNYAYTSAGFLKQKVDREGNKTSYVRNSKGQETSRTEAVGTADARTITTEWHPTFNRRIKVIEPSRETNYNYDTNGNLLSQQRTDLTSP